MARAGKSRSKSAKAARRPISGTLTATLGELTVSASGRRRTRLQAKLDEFAAEAEAYGAQFRSLETEEGRRLLERNMQREIVGPPPGSAASSLLAPQVKLDVKDILRKAVPQFPRLHGEDISGKRGYAQRLQKSDPRLTTVKRKTVENYLFEYYS